MLPAVFNSARPPADANPTSTAAAIRLHDWSRERQTPRVRMTCAGDRSRLRSPPTDRADHTDTVINVTLLTAPSGTPPGGGAMTEPARPRGRLRARADARSHHPHRQPARAGRRRPRHRRRLRADRVRRRRAGRRACPATATGRSAPASGRGGRSAGCAATAARRAVHPHPGAGDPLARHRAPDPDGRLARRHADPVRRARRPLRPRHRRRPRSSASSGRPTGRASPGPRHDRHLGGVDEGRARRALRGAGGQGRRHPARCRLRAVGGGRRRGRADDGDRAPCASSSSGATSNARAGSSCSTPSARCAPTASTSSSTSSPATTVAARAGRRASTTGSGPNSPELIELYHGADVFCLPTLGDCLPMVLSEAGAVGLPLVSTDVGAISEIVRDGETGLLVPVGDADALAAALAPAGRRSRPARPPRRRARGASSGRLRRGDERRRGWSTCSSPWPRGAPLVTASDRRRPVLLTVSGTIPPDLDARRSPTVADPAPTTSRWPRRSTPTCSTTPRPGATSGRLGRLLERLAGANAAAGLGVLPAPPALPRRVHRRRAGRPAVRRAVLVRPAPAAPRDDRPPPVAAEEGRCCTARCGCSGASTRRRLRRAAARRRRRHARLPAGARRAHPFMVDTDVLATRPRRRHGAAAADDLRRRPGAARLPDAGRGRPRARRRRRRRRGQPVVEARATARPASTSRRTSRSARSASFELRQLYADAAFVVVPLQETDFQAGITTILEAMAMGRGGRLHAHDRPDRHDRRRRDRRLRPAGDVGALRAAIERLLADPATAARLGAAGRAWVVEHADIQAYATDLSELL